MSWNKLTAEKFIAKARQIHGDKYSYESVIYQDARTDVIIQCPVHGSFDQRPDNHLHGKGCPVCALGGTAEERFWRWVDKNGTIMPHMDTSCWEWTGRIRNKYGALWVGGKTIKASRFSYELHYGIDLSSEIWVLHRCDNPKCVNPTHLFLGTAVDNVRDMIEKGRQHDQTGEKNHRALLSWDKVREIRRLYATGEFRQKDLAERYHVSLVAINGIVNYTRWKEKE